MQSTIRAGRHPGGKKIEREVTVTSQESQDDSLLVLSRSGGDVVEIGEVPAARKQRSLHPSDH